MPDAVARGEFRQLRDPKLDPFKCIYCSIAPQTPTTANFISAVASRFASGGIAGGNIQAALQGAFTAGLMQGLLADFDLPNGAHGTLGERGQSTSDEAVAADIRGWRLQRATINLD